MRIVATLAISLAAVGCKDRAPQAQPAAETQARAQARPAPALQAPVVEGPGLVSAVGLGPTVMFTKQAIEVDGERIVTIDGDGQIDKARLEHLIRTLEQKATGQGPVALALDATLPYRRVGVLLDALRKGGFRNLALLAGASGKMIPIELTDPAEANRGGLRPVVTLQHGRLVLWSASGLEGTKGAPKLSFELAGSTSMQPLTRALAEIVQRRWPDGKRPAEDRTIIVQLDGNHSAERMLQVLAAVRADGTLELFPSIFLAGGG